MVINSRGVGVAMLVLRILTLLSLAASIVAMTSNNFTNVNDADVTFTDITTYRLPFAVYYVCTEKRMIRNSYCLPEFDFYGDKVVSFLLATGVSAGFAVTYELKKGLDVLERAGVTDLGEARMYLDKGDIATGILLVGFACMALTSVFSSIARTLGRRFFG